ncbi:MAG: hypothetical protein ABIV28_07715, partial [Longimicrobiales bacterium]
MKRILALMLAGAVTLSACQGNPERPDGPATRAGLERGRDAAANWMAQDSATASSAIALGYLERLRLGMGSPFRLIDFALRDPRLSDSTRTTLAWSLLERTLNGDSYEIDGAALDRGGAATISSWPGLGRKHLELITDAIDDAHDPRSGELAVRLGYALAATEGSLPVHSPRYAANAAALIRDRMLSMQDAAALLQEAERTQTNTFTVLRQFRADRRLRVEAPPLATLPQDAEREALLIAPRIAQSLRELGAKPDLKPARDHAPD